MVAMPTSMPQESPQDPTTVASIVATIDPEEGAEDAVAAADHIEVEEDAESTIKPLWNSLPNEKGADDSCK